MFTERKIDCGSGLGCIELYVYPSYAKCLCACTQALVHTHAHTTALDKNLALVYLYFDIQASYS